jgi:hypothetical protein
MTTKLGLTDCGEYCNRRRQRHDCSSKESNNYHQPRCSVAPATDVGSSSQLFVPSPHHSLDVISMSNHFPRNITWGPPMNSNLSQFNSVHILLTHFSYMKVSITSSPPSWSSNWFLSNKFLHQNSLCISSFQYTSGPTGIKTRQVRAPIRCPWDNGLSRTQATITTSIVCILCTQHSACGH